MRRIEWLPPHPLTVPEVLSYRKFDHIVEIRPMVGCLPDPQSTIVTLDAGIHDQALWTVSDPRDETWRADPIPVREANRRLDRIIPDLVDRLTEYYPDTRFALVTPHDPRQN